MPYNKDQHSNLGYVDKKFKDMLVEICSIDKRSIKDELELLIMRRYYSVDRNDSQK